MHLMLMLTETRKLAAVLTTVTSNVVGDNDMALVKVRHISRLHSTKQTTMKQRSGITNYK